MPLVQAFLLADRVYRDEISRKCVIAGTFNAITAHAFPSRHPAGSCIYLALTGFSGELRLELVLKHAKTDTNIGSMAFKAESRDKLRLTESTIVLPSLLFPAEGEYHFELLHATTKNHIATIRLMLIEQAKDKPEA